MERMTLEERKQVSFEILKDISNICKKENISYYLAYGTLLGAIRHNGFIPWDDDVDIWIDVEDYWKFAEVMRKTDYDVLFFPYNNGWNMQFIKISDSRTVILDKGCLSNRGVSVDVFPLVRKYTTNLYRIANVLNWYREPISSLKSGKKIFTKLIPENVLYSCFRKLLSRKSLEGSLYGMFSPYSIEKDTYKEEWFKPIYHTFENYSFTIPKEFDLILTRLYGNYMVPPDEEHRNSGHDVEAYWKENQSGNKCDYFSSRSI